MLALYAEPLSFRLEHLQAWQAEAPTEPQALVEHLRHWPRPALDRRVEQALLGIDALLLEKVDAVDLASRVRLSLSQLERLFGDQVGLSIRRLVLWRRLRLALAIALIVAITVEIVINPRGLGHEMMAAQQALQFDRMYACLLWVGVLGWVVSELSLAGVRSIPGLRLEAVGDAR